MGNSVLSLFMKDVEKVSSDDLDRAEILLNRFFIEAKKLEKIKRIKKFKRFDKNWYALVEYAGKSFLALYEFHTLLRNRHPYFGFDKEDYELNRSLISFYMDLVLSKLKHTFYKEFPSESLNSINFYRSSDIYTIGARLIQTDPLQKNEIQKLLASFYYKIFLFYDFLYSKKENIGTFSEFEASKEKYLKTKDTFAKLDDVKTIKEFRNNTFSIIQNILNDQLELMKNSVDENSKNKDFIYDLYIEKIFSAKQISKIEPLSYFTAFKFWKIRKFIQSKFESSENLDNKFITSFKSYKKCIEKENDKLYEQNKIYSNFFLNMYRCDFEFAKKHYLNGYIHK